MAPRFALTPQFVLAPTLVGLLALPLSDCRADTIVFPHGATTPGVDVSQFQGSVNWSAVAHAGMTFAIARASTGTNAVDTKFQQNWSGIAAAGLVRGAYQTFRPSQNAVAQANLFLSQIGTLHAGDLPPVLDVEVSDGQSPPTIQAGIATWVARVQQATGRTPIIYTTRPIWNTLVASSSNFSTNLWVAAWNAPAPTIPSAWTDWKIWQNSSTGSVPGISGPVDLDLFNGSSAALRSFVAPLPTSLGLGLTMLAGVGSIRMLRRRTVATE